MKKRLLRNLLILGLLLIALTATVAAAYTGEEGHLSLNVNGQDLLFIVDARYDCENDHGNTYLFSNRKNDKLINVQARKPDKTTVVPIAEWRPGDTILASIEISNFNCAKPDGNACGTMNKTIKTTLEFSADDFCHRMRNSSDALTVKMEHIRGDDVNDCIYFKFYCYLSALYQLEHHKAGKPTCEEDGYDTEWYRCPLCGKSFSDRDGKNEITVKKKLGHDFDADGVCTRENCDYHAEAYIYSSLTKPNTYYDTVANAINNAKAPAESVHVVSYKRETPITINKVVYLTVENGVTVPEIRMESFSGWDTGNLFVNINNYGTVQLFSSAATVTSRYQGVIYFNHNRTNQITTASTIAVQIMQISNTSSGTIGEINIPQTANTTPKVQVANNGGKIERLTGYPKNVALCNGTGSYGKITTAAESGSADALLNTGCYLYFPNGVQKWVNSNAGKTVSDVIVSNAPFTLKVKQGDTELEPSNGSYTVDNVTVDSTVALGVDFTPNEYGLTVDESKITSRWYYKDESKNAADGKALTLEKIQYGVYDLIFEAKESRYGFTTSVSVKVNVNPPEGKTAISLKNQLTSDSYTKVYDGTTRASEILPPIEFQLADGREIRISEDYYEYKAEYKSPDCIKDNKIIVTVTLTPEGQKHYELTGGRIEVPATITRYDGEQIHKVFFVDANTDSLRNDPPYIGKPVLKYLNLIGYLFDSEGHPNRKVLTSEDGFQYSFYHLRPGATKPDPELDELLTADSVFTYPEEGYNVYAVVEPSLNYTGCITDSNSFFYVYDDKYIDKPHTHDEKTYTDWNGSSLSIAPGETATRYLSGAQANVNVELALSQKKTLDLCLYNKAVHVIGSSHDQIYLVGGSTLVLSDCRKTGKVIGSAVASGSGGVAYVKNGTLSIYDVKLTGGIAKNGGAIVVDKDGTLNLYSGEISGNHVTGGNGGAIYIKSGGVVNMYGGKIQNNHAYSGSGGAIYVEAGGTLNLYGGTITGNTASGFGGGIYVEEGGTLNIQGAPVVTGNTAGGKDSNVYLAGGLLSISDQLGSDAEIGISINALSYPALFARSTEDYSAHFIPDDANTFVLRTDGGLALAVKPSATRNGTELTVTTGDKYASDACILFVAEYGKDGRMLAVQSKTVEPGTAAYTFTVKNSGAKLKCFLLRKDTYTPLFEAFTPQ